MGASLITAEPAETTGTDLYELVLFNSTGTCVLLQHDNGKRGLPEVHIPQFTRPAEQITALLRSSWGFKAVLLWSGWIEGEPSSERFAILEVIGNSEQMIPGWKWVATDQAIAHLEGPQAKLVQKSQLKALRTSEDADPEPFSRLGWIHRLEDWINGVLRPSGRLVRDFSQFNGSETFSLVRFETDSKPLWFKAVGEPNVREFPITLLLSQLFPAYLPKLLASNPLVNGWLMDSGGDQTLDDRDDLSRWVDVACRLAELQMTSIGRTAALLEAGCHDLRVETLRASVAPFFESMNSLMNEQETLQPLPLTSADLLDLATATDHALNVLADIDIPDALGHSDFNPGNILIEDYRSVFIDWNAAHIGHPFLTFEYLLAQLEKRRRIARYAQCLREAYTRCWLRTATFGGIQRALRLAPLIALYAHATAGQAWRDPKRLVLPQFRSYLRGLARRMKKKAEDPK